MLRAFALLCRGRANGMMRGIALLCRGRANGMMKKGLLYSAEAELIE